jgi:hypothetical protein
MFASAMGGALMRGAAEPHASLLFSSDAGIRTCPTSTTTEGI